MFYATQIIENISKKVRKTWKHTSLKNSPDYYSTEALKKNIFAIPNINWTAPRHNKNALIVVPFYGKDASSYYSDDVARRLSENGYRVHAVIYNDSPYEPKSRFWHSEYYVRAQTGNFGKSKALPGSTKVDGLDDWAGDELALFVAALSNVIHFDICICNYIFLSRVFEVLAPETLRILLTHDIFSGRNARIQANGGTSGFYFSTDDDGERQALNRADIAVAIQSDEADHFRNLVAKARVDVLPYLPPRRYQTPRNCDRVVVGFIASGHQPNIDAILNFVKAFKRSSDITLLVAGSVCAHLTKVQFPAYVNVLGIIDNLDEFYSSCDVIINPDTLKSGLKIKCVEALSFGKPLICTAAASAGIGLTAPYHLMKSAAQVAEYCLKAATDRALRLHMAEESRSAFEAFAARHKIDQLISNYIEMADAKRDSFLRRTCRSDA